MKFKKFIASLCCASLLIPQIYIDVNAEEIDVSEVIQETENIQETESAEYVPENETLPETELITESTIETISETLEIEDVEETVLETIIMEESEIEETEMLLADESIKQGTFGDNITWTYDLDKCVLTLSGYGKMNNDIDYYDIPWNSYRSSIKEIIIENGITSIRDSAFNNCILLSKVKLPESISKIGIWAFDNCPELKTAGPMGSGCNIEFGWSEKIPDSAFYEWDSLTTVIIPDTITTIGNNAFLRCPALKSVNIPDSVNTIGYNAFQGCKSLTTISIPDSVTKVYTCIFKDCTNLKNVKVSASADSLPGFQNCTSLKTIIIPEGVTYISGFEGCISLESVVLPKSTTQISNNAFENCIQLKSVVIPDNVWCIGGNAFEGCSNLSQLTLSSNTRYIDSDVFLNCPKLKNITLRIITEPSTEYNRYSIVLVSNNSYNYTAEYLREIDKNHKEWITAYTESVTLPNNKYFTAYELVPGGTFVNHTGTSIQVKNELTGTTTTLANNESLSNPLVQVFVANLYSVCLNRNPDATGLNYWADRLTNKEIDGVTAAYGFIFSSEFINKNLCNEDYVKQLYNAFLGRTADAVGLADWVGQLNSGTTREAIFNGFALSQEFNGLCNKYGINQGKGIDIPAQGTVPDGKCAVCGKSTTVSVEGVTGFVKRLYKVCLNREADAVGLSDWTGKLKAHKATGRSVAYGFIFSQEFINKKYSNADYIEKLYEAFMGRGSDPAGKSDWLNRMSKQGWTREQVFDGFVGSREFTDICNSYGITRD